MSASRITTCRTVYISLDGRPQPFLFHKYTADQNARRDWLLSRPTKENARQIIQPVPNIIIIIIMTVGDGVRPMSPLLLPQALAVGLADLVALGAHEPVATDLNAVEAGVAAPPL